MVGQCDLVQHLRWQLSRFRVHRIKYWCQFVLIQIWLIYVCMYRSNTSQGWLQGIHESGNRFWVSKAKYILLSTNCLPSLKSKDHISCVKQRCSCFFAVLMKWLNMTFQLQLILSWGKQDRSKYTILVIPRAPQWVSKQTFSNAYCQW